MERWNFEERAGCRVCIAVAPQCWLKCCKTLSHVVFECHSIKSGKVVILLAGRYAGRKAVVVKAYDEGSDERKFGHAMVAGIARYPRKVSFVFCAGCYAAPNIPIIILHPGPYHFSSVYSKRYSWAKMPV